MVEGFSEQDIDRRIKQPFMKKLQLVLSQKAGIILSVSTTVFLLSQSCCCFIITQIERLFTRTPLKTLCQPQLSFILLVPVIIFSSVD